jgi:hypothetical protein
MDPTKSSAATAAGIAADYSARATYARGYEDGSKHVDEVGIQLAALRERLRLAMAAVGVLRDIAEHDCRYGDGCPRFGSNHGVCVGCRARRGLAALDAVPGDALAGDNRRTCDDKGRWRPIDTSGARWVGPDGEPER